MEQDFLKKTKVFFIQFLYKSHKISYCNLLRALLFYLCFCFKVLKVHYAGFSKKEKK